MRSPHPAAWTGTAGERTCSCAPPNRTCSIESLLFNEINALIEANINGRGARHSIDPGGFRFARLGVSLKWDHRRVAHLRFPCRRRSTRACIGFVFQFGSGSTEPDRCWASAPASNLDTRSLRELPSATWSCCNSSSIGAGMSMVMRMMRDAVSHGFTRQLRAQAKELLVAVRKRVILLRGLT